MRELSLFAGAGGGILGGKLLGWETICAVEIEPYCREVLLRRQRDGVLPVFPIWDDIRTFDGRPWRGLVDVVSGGFPCQPFSVAGKRLADADERNLWPETARVLGEVRPRWALLENVPGLVSHDYFATIVGDLAALGFDCAWGVVGADDVGAPHKRERLWIVADAAHKRHERAGTARRRRDGLADGGQVADADAERSAQRGLSDAPRDGVSDAAGSGGISSGAGGSEEVADLADAERERGRGGTTWSPDAADAGQSPAGPWERDPADDPVAPLGRVASGIPHRVHRLRALGNAQVPLVAATAWRVLSRALEGAE